MIPQRTMRPSAACASKQLNLRCSQQTHHPQSPTLGLQTNKLYAITHNKILIVVACFSPMTRLGRCAVAPNRFNAVSPQWWGVYTIQQTSSKLPANVFKIHVLMLHLHRHVRRCKQLVRSCYLVAKRLEVLIAAYCCFATFSMSTPAISVAPLKHNMTESAPCAVIALFR